MPPELPALDPIWVAIASKPPIPTTKITRIVAPTGYGKTALAAYWYQQWQQQHAQPGFWFNATQADNELLAFTSHISQLLDLPLPDISQASALSISAALQAQFNQWQPSCQRLLVLDNLHQLTNPDVLALIQLLLQHPAVTSIICSRFHHNPQLSAFRLKQQLTEINAEQLRLSSSQTPQTGHRLPLILVQPALSVGSALLRTSSRDTMAAIIGRQAETAMAANAETVNRTLHSNPH